MMSPSEQTIVERFVDHPGDDADARVLLSRLVAEELPLAAPDEAAATVARLHAELVGMGPLDALLDDDSVTDILVNGAGPVWVERAGRLGPSGVSIDDAEIGSLVERAFHRNGLTVDRAHPIGDTRLRDGARLSVVLPPLAVDGIHVAVRKFATVRPDLAAFGPAEVIDRLRADVAARANIVVFGATGSGKTSLVNALSSAIDPMQRVVTIEDAAELRLGLPHVVRLEGRPDNGDGAGRVELRALVRAALRLRPDRIVVGEVRGPEALDMIWAMATGHDGSLSTCHAKSAADVLARLETFVLLAGADLPLSAVRAQVRTAVDVVVGVRRDGAGRRVVSIHEVTSLDGHPSGVVPVFVEGRWRREPPADRGGRTEAGVTP